MCGNARAIPPSRLEGARTTEAAAAAAAAVRVGVGRRRRRRRRRGGGGKGAKQVRERERGGCVGGWTDGRGKKGGKIVRNVLNRVINPLCPLRVNGL